MPRKLIWFFAAFIVIFTSCYKDPFYNDEAFMAGKWELVRIQKPRPSQWGETFPPEDCELPFNFQFHVKKEGEWVEFIEGVEIKKYRVITNAIYLDRENIANNYLLMRFYKYNSLFDDNNYEGWYKFYFNESKDTLKSTSYLPDRLYQDNGSVDILGDDPIFTFVKIQ